MTELAGHLNEQDLMEECEKEAVRLLQKSGTIPDWGRSPKHTAIIVGTMQAALVTLRRRQCLSDIGLEQIKLSEERMK